VHLGTQIIWTCINITHKGLRAWFWFSSFKYNVTYCEHGVLERGFDKWYNSMRMPYGRIRVIMVNR
jgi:hypothetical protein